MSRDTYQYYLCAAACMNKEKIIKALKISLIVFLLMAISLLAIMQWKSDLIIDKVMSSMQAQLVDSLKYSDAGMDWFKHFPFTSIHISNLQVGSGTNALIEGGDIDVVISLFPLLKNRVKIRSLQVNDSAINIAQQKGHWSYDILKKSESPTDTSFQTLIQELVLNNTTLKYDDEKTLGFNLAIASAKIKGQYDHHILNTEIKLDGVLNDLKMNEYKQLEPFEIAFEGAYKFDMNTGLQEFREWSLQNEAIELTAQGTVLRETDHEVVDMDVSWKKGRPEILKKWLPEKMMSTWNKYKITGESEGEAKISGNSSQKETPHIICSATLKNGGVDFGSGTDDIKGLSLDVNYDNGNEKTKNTSTLNIFFSKSSVFGASLEGDIKIKNVEKPVIDASLKGSLPADLINLIGITGLNFEKGSFIIDDFVLNHFQPEQSSLSSFLQNGKTSFTAKDVSFTYTEHKIAITEGMISLERGKLNFDFDALTWNKANAKDLKGHLLTENNQLTFSLESELCEGKIESKGTITGLNQKPVYTAQWKVVGIEMKPLLESFSNFDQTFITSENLDGKANIWAESTIPLDDNWNMLYNQIQVKGAIDIRDGQLKGMKTLEDFSKYIHLDDLRDIHFNQIRNYLKIENGKVYLPVMFIQSNALNMSISGEHSFDQDITYYLKLNAGQVAANKLKKNDVKKDFKKASKSGWINMYFVLEGTTSDVKYQQYRNAVIAGFEQSSSLKESLRNYLVDKFGYDVYWIEPNEWEDIPEY